MTSGWRDGSVVKLLAAQAWQTNLHKPEFDLWNPQRREETTESTQLSSDFHVHAIVFLLTAFPHPPHTHIIFKARMAYYCLVFLLSQWSRRWYRILAVALFSCLQPVPLFWSVFFIYRHGLCLVSLGKFYLCLFLSDIRGSITSQSEVSWFR